MLTELLGFYAGIMMMMMMMDDDHYLTAGTDEVSMGMVKRVLYTATGGSCRDPEAVSYCRNKSGG